MNRDEIKESVKKQFPRAKSKTLKELKSPNVFNFYQLTIRERISLKVTMRIFPLFSFTLLFVGILDIVSSRNVTCELVYSF